MDKIILLNCKELDISHNHIAWFTNSTNQLNWFLKHESKVLDNTIYNKQNNFIKLSGNIKEYEIYNYCIIYDYYLQKNIFYHIFNKQYINEKTTGIILKKDVIQTYMFDIDYSSKKSLIDRCFLNAFNTKGFINYDRLLTNEGLETGEYYMKKKYNVYNYASKGGYIITSSEKLGSNVGGNSGGTTGGSGEYSDGISENLFLFLKGYEQFAPNAINFGDGVLTIGYGITSSSAYYNELAPTCTEEEASNIMYKSIMENYYGALKDELSKRIGAKQNEIDAFVSLSYNCGVGGCSSSPMFEKYINNEPLSECAKDWATYYINSGTVFENGLRDRRSKEVDMFLNNKYHIKPIYDINGNKIVTNGGKGHVPSEILKNNTSNVGLNIVISARKLIGKPYVWGGNVAPLGSSEGTDCSGLCQWAYNDNGIKITRTTYTQINEGEEVLYNDLKEGDLCFSRFSSVNVPEHVFLFSGWKDGKSYCVEAQTEGTTIFEHAFTNQNGMRYRRLL